ncbi:hypothetical protein [uncultured Acetatifactor sp.]|jgi:hypothetical protein|uniref:hypothetical protein n=1 Tax=uncultured Acetatifactor sp. TaxID=1671927 RepID=UPI0026346FD0|nr:hypothetical protein [uncultured Acetatifactor sp.]
MELNTFKDMIFELFNETDNLPIVDIMVNDRKNEIKIFLADHSSFSVKCSKGGSWFIQKPVNSKGK